MSILILQTATIGIKIDLSTAMKLVEIDSK